MSQPFSMAKSLSQEPGDKTGGGRASNSLPLTAGSILKSK